VTLAPEMLPAGTIAALVGGGVKVALGHSMATYAETQTALAEGLSGLTHLFNAMPAMQAREPGPVGAALETAGCWYGLIADGMHVHPAMLRIALHGAGRPLLVTDAMPPVGGVRDSFTLYGETISANGGRWVRADGTLAGSGLDMASAVRNAVRMLRLSLPQALAMASRRPAEAIGLGRRLGRLAAGYRADLVALEPEAVKVVATWVAGERSAAEPRPSAPSS
jgi:N-acetylglucosamine-6-phosphate deacetylase